MASARSAVPVGSAQWLINESKQADQLVRQEVEEFMFSEAQHEIEWLNAHLTEIFDKNKLNVTDVFKTPGKLRGKTPRTARKRQPLQNRAPLTDIFAPNVQAIVASPPKGILLEQLRDAAHEDNIIKLSPGSTNIKGSTKKNFKANTDSGYYGRTDDEKDSDDAASLKKLSVPLDKPIHSKGEKESDDRCISDASFVSANENFGSRVVSRDQTPPESEQNETNDENDETIHPISKPPQEPAQNHEPTEIANTQSPKQGKDVVDSADVDEPLTPSDGSSPEKPLIRKSSLNFASLPAREPLTGKKSLGPQSSRPSHHNGMANRMSRAARSLASSSQENGVQSTQEPKARYAGIDSQHEEYHMKESVAAGSEELSAKLHNKTSTQRLHDRITMLGQSKDSRNSKSMVSKSSFAQPNYPRLPTNGANDECEVDFHDGDKAMAEASTLPYAFLKSTNGSIIDTTQSTSDDVPEFTRKPKNAEKDLPPKPMDIEDEKTPNHAEDVEPSAAIHVYSEKPDIYGDSSKASSLTALSSTATHTLGPGPLPQKAISVSNPEVQQQQQKQKEEIGNNEEQHATSTTPSASPKRYGEGPLSASKAKLYSVLKSAKGIFASSASVSAQARLEMLTPPPQQPSRPKGNLAIPSQIHLSNRSPYAKENNTQADDEASNQTEDLVLNANRNGFHLTPHSSKMERENKKKEKGAKEILRLESELEKARAEEREKAAFAAHKNERSVFGKTENVPIMSSGNQREHENVTDNKLRLMSGALEESDGVSNMPPPTKAPTEVRRPIKKPSKDTLPRAKPAPVSIKVASQLVGHAAPPKVSTASTIHDPAVSMTASSLATAATSAPATKRTTTITNKSSNSSLHTSASNNSLKSSVNSTTSRPKALESAARKKEQEKKAAERKAAQKREIEQKRLAKLEEERRADQQRKVAEQQRAQEARKAAQRQLELRRAEQQQRILAAAAVATASHQNNSSELGDAMMIESTSNSTAAARQGRPDLPSSRPVSRMMALSSSDTAGRNLSTKAIPHINPAKPAKRPLQVDSSNGNHGGAGNRHERESAAAQRQQLGQSYQKLDAKRRKTNENGGFGSGDYSAAAGVGAAYNTTNDGENNVENEIENQSQENRRSVMAPPIRQSNIRKDASKFAHGYMAVPPAPSHVGSVFKSAQQQQQQQHSGNSKATIAAVNAAPTIAHHPNDMAKFSTAKIPFAGAVNANTTAAAAAAAASAPPHTSNSQHTITAVANTSASTSTVSHTATYKTPLRPAGPTAPLHYYQQQQHHQMTSSITTTTAASTTEPIYPPGETIALPEIHTDSEDDTDDASSTNPSSSPYITTFNNSVNSPSAINNNHHHGNNNNNNGSSSANVFTHTKTTTTTNKSSKFTAPSWVQSPALRSILAAQQLVDPAQIFGPIAPLHMEEIFRSGGSGKGGKSGGGGGGKAANAAKERLKKFRDRTSSANWSGADALTEEERRRDREARERLCREGRWRFGV